MKMNDSMDAFASLLDHIEIKYGKLKLKTSITGSNNIWILIWIIINKRLIEINQIWFTI